jgi:hypothetical protein
MARLLSITRSSSLQPTVRKRTFGVPLKIGPVSLSIMTIGMIGFLALFYIIETSITSSEGFKVHQLEERTQELRDENQKLEVEASKLRALDRLEESLKTSDTQFVPVTKVTTVRLPEDAVAVSQDN